MRDKSLNEMAASLFPHADRVILTTLNNPRAASIEELVASAPEDFDQARVLRAPSVEGALQLARMSTPTESLICVTGSLYLVGAAQAALRSR